MMIHLIILEVVKVIILRIGSLRGLFNPHLAKSVAVSDELMVEKPKFVTYV